MNILLLYPEFPDTFWSFKHALRFIRKRASLPPLGLLTVAALLPEDWCVRLIDLNVRKLSQADLAWADLAFVSAMVIQRDAARALIARCKREDLTVVAGGPLFASEHEQFPEVDHFVLGEAEVTLPAFLADLAAGNPAAHYAASAFPDIRTSPAPRWDLLELKRYASMSIQYSRGCPFDCEFCNITTLYGHKPRIKSAGQIIAELNGLYAIGWRGRVFFVDDNFIGNKHHLRNELLPALIEWRRGKRGIGFHTEVSINLADDKPLAQMMVAAGFDMVFIGIETPDEAGLKECSKKQNQNRNLIESVRTLQRIGLQVQGGFIVGFDSDSPSTFQRQIDFIQRSGIVTAMVGLLQAPSGTRLYQRLKGEGRLTGAMTGDNVDGTTNIIPKMSLDSLREGYRSILQGIYSHKPYYRRVQTFLREYKAPRVRGRFKREELWAFLRSIFVLGIISKERASYWKLLVWTNFHCPRQLPLAITLAITGHHCRRICELHIH